MKNKKLNIIDVIIITALILIIAAAVARAVRINSMPDTVKDKEILYTIEICDIDGIYLDSVKPGDNLYISDKALYCGTVHEVSTSYVKRSVQYDDGTLSPHSDPSKVNITLKILMSADTSDDGFYIGNNTFLYPGEMIDAYTRYFNFSGKITGFADFEQ